MGGNALTVFTRRYDKTEYLELQDEVVKKLSNIYNAVLTIPSYNNKQTYGDLDLIVSKPKPINLNSYLTTEFNTKQIVNNNQYVSFEYKEFQVDLIHIQQEDLQLAKTYFSYNDLGMLMGILSKRLNCKYGFNGLYYTYYNSDRSYKKDILLTKNIATTFEFLDLSYSKFLEGFNELEDIFAYVISSKYFDTKAFTNEEEWNHTRRNRNRKRNTWHKFIDYLKTNNIQISNPKLEAIKYYISDYFNINLVEQIEQLDYEQTTKAIIKTKFNGVIVNELTELVDKELGKFISNYKNSKEDFSSYIVNTDSNLIKQDIINYFNNYEN